MSCPYCGATIPASYEKCQALMHDITNEAYAGNTGSFGLYRAAFDAYTLQHPEIYCVSAKSYAAHLGGMACWAEYAGKNEVYEALQRWLNGKVELVKPTVPAPMLRGKLTVLDIYEFVGMADYPQKVAAWCAEVWAAYVDLHEVAQDYIALAFGKNENR